MSEEGRTAAKFLQGGLVAVCTTKGAVPVKIEGVDQETDEDGIYKDFFTVITKSGLRIRVTVQEE